MNNKLSQFRFPVKLESEWLYILAEANADENFENAYRACAKAYRHCVANGLGTPWTMLVDAFADSFQVAAGYDWREPVIEETAIPEDDYFIWQQTTTQPLFTTGPVYMTQGVRDVNIRSYLRRHLRGDWGDLCDDDKAANDMALIAGTRIFSAYHTPEGKIWIITEADRSSTTVLTPEEY